MDKSEQINTVAMNIIMDAGDARSLITDALVAIEKNQFTVADEKIMQAQLKIKAAHGNQTDIIQSEIHGEAFPFSLLFIHAQDTLMTINSELLMSRHLLKVFRLLDQRISALEQ
ncbi:PTS lactose/cellobiose transporter subunit IIA [Superficieibacter electus]|uniref:PTS lactose/cellobiose transporter subunit IIA n=1 Tax=Superficieibacter electus TaxID=2022662 RepID=A0A2P5GVV1_9ENTR|nr:PTS lactose/cellobiose transporter subunit IIA [Superficieibacter electus]POP47661.1 PTS lactose/cellobiose transporter subunit IIA [Superficieibacter electus]POP50672.1 PTS lactose/cellobiose transporter subunit IIA [Superficieibacter electus]